MNKKILISLAVIGIVAAITAGATTAYFSDTAESEGNTFTAGDMEVSVSGHENQEFPVSFTNMEPGKVVGPKKLLLRNTGSLTEMIDSITVSGLEENDKKVISECFASDGPETTECTNIHGNVDFEVDYGPDSYPNFAVYKLTVPGIELTDGDNFDLTFDTDADGTADFQIKHQKGSTNNPANHSGNWHYAPVENGSWDKWNDLPGNFYVAKNGDNYTIKIPLSVLGGSDSEYRFGFQGRWNGDYPSENNAGFKYPNYFSWGENAIGSEDYKPMDTGEVDKGAGAVAQNIDVWAYKGNTNAWGNHIWSGTLHDLYSGSNAIPNTNELKLEPGDYGKYQFRFRLSGDVGNPYQGDGVDATFKVKAVQEGQE